VVAWANRSVRISDDALPRIHHRNAVHVIFHILHISTLEDSPTLRYFGFFRHQPLNVHVQLRLLGVAPRAAVAASGLSKSYTK
jgi:hypothetical protein